MCNVYLLALIICCMFSCRSMFSFIAEVSQVPKGCLHMLWGGSHCGTNKGEHQISVKIVLFDSSDEFIAQYLIYILNETQKNLFKITFKKLEMYQNSGLYQNITNIQLVFLSLLFLIPKFVTYIESKQVFGHLCFFAICYIFNAYTSFNLTHVVPLYLKYKST